MALTSARPEPEQRPYAGETPHRPGTDQLERAVEHLQQARWLDPLIQAPIRFFGQRIRRGPVKDLLSGTPLGHPTHPLLTDVTIGAWTCGVLFDLAPSAKARRAADSLIMLGTISALPTAVTGLSDLADVENKQVRRIGGAHALGNVSATILFAMSSLMRKRGRRGAGIALSAAGTLAATAAGYLGGHLAYRRGIGVDRTVFDDTIQHWTPAIRADELGEHPLRVRVGRNDVMIASVGGTLVAIANRCSHRGGPLHKGTLDDATVTCPWHLSTFRLSDGAVVNGPACAPQPAYDARMTDGMIEIRSR